MSHKAVIMVPLIIELRALDPRVAQQEARDAVAQYESYDWPFSASKKLEPKLLAFEEDLEMRGNPSPPMAA